MAMEQDPDERFQSAEAMRKAILEEREAQTSFAPYTKGLAASDFFEAKHIPQLRRYHNRDERGILSSKEHFRTHDSAYRDRYRFNHLPGD